MDSLVFDHVGITTTERQPNEDWIEASKIWVTNPRHHPEKCRPGGMMLRRHLVVFREGSIGEQPQRERMIGGSVDEDEIGLLRLGPHETEQRALGAAV